MTNYSKIADGFRFVTSSHTAVRALSIVSQIIKIIEQNQIPKQFLRPALVEWSSLEEQKSTECENHRSKIAENGKATSSFQHYLDFSVFLGLITYHDDLFMLSRLGLLLNKLLNEHKEIESQLTKK